ncbi:hypothetical protein RFI_35557, partial [Reticulomyxa filosa]
NNNNNNNNKNKNNNDKSRTAKVSDNGNGNDKEEVKVSLNSKGCWLEGPLNGFLANCADDNCASYTDVELAKQKCLAIDSCSGVVQLMPDHMYQLRQGTDLRPSASGQNPQNAQPQVPDIAKNKPLSSQCVFTGPHKGYLETCASDECKRFYYYEDAKEACLKMKDCVGITRVPGLRQSFELRAVAPVVVSDNDEYSTCQINGMKQMLTDSTVTSPPDPFVETVTRYEQIGSKVNGLPTIYVGVASYRDDMCQNSVFTAFSRAKYPERIFVGVVQQNLDEDPECVVPEQPCDVDPTQIFCKWKDH